jgi:hypothetical protein
VSLPPLRKLLPCLMNFALRCFVVELSSVLTDEFFSFHLWPSALLHRIRLRSILVRVDSTLETLVNTPLLVTMP